MPQMWYFQGETLNNLHETIHNQIIQNGTYVKLKYLNEKKIIKTKLLILYWTINNHKKLYREEASVSTDST